MSRVDFKSIFSLYNRGILLDVSIFFFNTFLMIFLSSRFNDLIGQAKSGDVPAKSAIVLYSLGVCFLLPVGAVLKRRCVHRRNQYIDENFDGFFGLLLVGQFIAQLLFLINISFNSLDLAQHFTGKDYSDTLFLPLFLAVPALAGVNTAIVYFYFVKPKHKPFVNFLESARSEQLGDVSIFLNMILYQAFWGILAADLTKDYTGIFTRIFMLLFSALIIYMPPRIVYLAEDRERPIIWLTMLLANLPVILRIFLT